MSAEVDLGVVDLREVLDLAVARGAGLLTAGELLIVRRIRALEGDEARLYARLSGRKRTRFAVDRLDFLGRDASAVVDRLVECGLLTRWVPWPTRLEVITVQELKAACRLAKLRVGGKREVLVARVKGLRVGRDRDVVALCHPALIRRLERFALGRISADRSQFVLERMGMTRWPEYPRTGGAALFARRRDLLRWESLLGEARTPEQALDVLEDTERVWPPGRLDPRRRLRRAVMEAARQVEREGDLDRAEKLYRRLSEWVGRPAVAVRLARVLERGGDAHGAIAVLRQARVEGSVGERVAMDRAGRRLSSSLRKAWPPSRPLRRPKERRLRLAPAGKASGRPLWDDGVPVEAAVMARLQRAGRDVLVAEGPLWRSLFALLFAETYFLPVPGQLPVPFLSGPLDLHTPSFRVRRLEAVESVLDGIRSGEAGARVRAAVDQWWGVRLAGARWDRASGDELVRLASGMSGAALAAIMERLLAGSSGAAAGLPDLVILDGPHIRLADAHPSRLAEGVLLVEVKGPSDSTRDEQLAWNHHLLEAGAAVELWNVRS